MFVRFLTRSLFFLLLTTLAAAVGAMPVEPTFEPAFAALVFYKTAGYTHASIGDGITAIEALGNLDNFTVEASDDAGVINSANLTAYDVVIFLNTSGDILNSTQQAAFEAYIQSGGGFVGIHAAADTEYDWPWYGQLLGTWFQSHPPGTQLTTVKIVDPTHPSTQPLPPAGWEREDEWYLFQHNPVPGVNLLLQLEGTNHPGGTSGATYPIAWFHEFDGGRSWYTAMGHTPATYGEPLFRAHLRGGILWAAKQADLPARAFLPLIRFD